MSGLFVTEGRKNLLELIRSEFKIHRLLLTQKFYDTENVKLGKWYDVIEIISEKELVQCGTFQSNDAGLAIVHLQDGNSQTNAKTSLIMVLEDIRDPGNLGTILRIADWYGLRYIICSTRCADCYNTKVINSSMGSFFRVACIYTDLPTFLKEYNNIPILGAVLDGENIHDYDFPTPAIIVLGNESTGISHELQKHLTSRIRIPGYGHAESLNVAIASAIICDNFFRTKFDPNLSD